jgi:hypothetical protein
MKRLIIVSAIAATMLAGCSTTPKMAASAPAPVVPKDQKIEAVGKIESPMTIDIPNWYLKPPAATDDYIYFSGTATSADLSMSREKALLDAQLKVADTINGAMNALIKQQKSDNAGAVFSDKTSVTVKKVIANTIMTGYHIEDTRVVAENRSYRTFVLVRYPIGDTNRLLKERLQRDSQNNETDNSLQNELEQEIKAAAPKAKMSAAVSKNTIEPKAGELANGVALTQ